MAKKLKLTTFNYDDPPRRGEALRIGTTRRPPRGVTKDRWGEYFDVWFPIIAPSAELLQSATAGRDFQRFCERYEREIMSNAESRGALRLLATIALRTPIAIGCYCRDESRCHRSFLKGLIEREAEGLSVPL